MIDSLGHGIWCIDTGYARPGLAASYLVVDRGEAALIETGTSRSVPRILAALAAAGVDRRAVRWIVPTHVHLDHAGGAGALLAHCPEATVLAHPRGAPHLADPARLVAGATAVYGEEVFARLYGEITPVPRERLREAADGSAWELGSRRLRVLDTPGHARHHFCVWDETSRGWFTGDTFGVAYAELATAGVPFLLPTTTPVQFDPEALVASIGRLMEARPEALYLTHFGRLAASPALAATLCAEIAAYVRLCEEAGEAPDAAAELRARLFAHTLARLRAAGCRWREDALGRFLALDMGLNADGLLHWRRTRRA